MVLDHRASRLAGDEGGERQVVQDAVRYDDDPAMPAQDAPRGLQKERVECGQALQRKLPVVPGVCCSRWGSDGYIYFSPVGRTISRVREDGSGQVERVTELDQDQDANHGYFQILPGGSTGIFTVWGPPRRIEAMDLETGERKRIVEGFRAYVTPDMTLIFATTDGRLLAAPLDPETLELTAPPIPVVDGVGLTTQDDGMYSISEEGTLVYWSTTARGGDRIELVWVSRDGEATVVDPGWSFDGLHSWSLSPDGTMVAIGERTQTGDDIWVKTLPDGPRSRLTFDDGIEWKPRWSPDGAQITFLSDRDGQFKVWSRRADGIGQAELLVDYGGGFGRRILGSGQGVDGAPHGR